MKFHLIQPGMIGRRHEIEQGMAGQRADLYQRYLEEVRHYIGLADALGYASYGHNEHHMQIEGFEITNHPGMFSLFVGLHSKRLRVSTLGYVLPTHNPLRAAEEIATLDHMIGGRLNIGFSRGYQDRWVDCYAAVPGVRATTPELARNRDEADQMNRELFEECVQIVKKAWTNDVFSHKGKFWQFPPDGSVASHPAYTELGKGVDDDGIVREVGIAPHPLQEPHPPIYGAFAHSMRTVDMWAREGGRPVVMANQLDFCETLWNRYKETAATVGREVTPENGPAWGFHFILSDDPDKCRRWREEHDWYWEKWFYPFDQAQINTVVGTADDMARAIEHAHERLDFGEVWLSFSQGHLEQGENEEQIHHFAEKVIPQFSDKDADGTWV